MCINRLGLIASLLGIALCVAGCDTTSRINNTAGQPTRYVDPGGGDGGMGSGVEAQDIQDAAYAAASDILASRIVAQSQSPVRVLIEDHTIELNSSRQFENAFFVDQIRAALTRDGQGRVSVIDSLLVADRDSDGRPPTTAAGFDLVLDGAINQQVVIDPKTGVREETWQITFQLLKAEQMAWVQVWGSRPYWVRKRGQDSIMYR